jgi:hypothetical protein
VNNSGRQAAQANLIIKEGIAFPGWVFATENGLPPGLIHFVEFERFQEPSHVIGHLGGPGLESESLGSLRRSSEC